MDVYSAQWLMGWRVEGRRIFRPNGGQRQSHRDTHSNFDETMDGNYPRGSGVRDEHNDCECNPGKPIGGLIKPQSGAHDSHNEYSDAEHGGV